MSRVQFAFTVGYHILWPAYTIGISGLIASRCFLGFLGLGISLWPYAVPYSATLWDASSSPPTHAFVGIGSAVILPIVLGCLGYTHWIFRGETTSGSGYGN